MTDLTRIERQQIVTGFFSWLAITHDALILDRNNQTTAPISDLLDELVESYFTCIPA